MIPLEKSFLRVFQKPKKVRLSKQVIEVNYAHLSPFKNGGHLFFQTENSIYVWFLREPAQNGVCIPEGYLLYRNFRERGDGAIVLLPREGVLNAVVIGEGELKAQVTLQGGADQPEMLDLLKREYSLGSAEVIRLEPSSRFSPRPADLLAFAQFELNPSRLLEEGVALAKVPIITALIITAGFTLYRSHQMDSLTEEKMSRLNRLKRENGPVQASLDQVRDQGAYWRDFVGKERSYPDFYRLMAQITHVIQRHGGYLNNVEYADNRVTIWTGLKSSEAEIIKDLLATGLFTEVKLLSSAKEPIRPEFNTYNLSITLKPALKGVQS
jgi:hypothetical protein